MKRFSSRLLTGAALGCLLAMGASPALAYYPPVKATAAKIKGRIHEVACEVIDPQDGRKYGNVYMIVKEVVQADGVIALIRIQPGEYIKKSKSVTCVTYDPARKEFVDYTQGGYKDVYQLQVAGGVVAYIATDLEGQPFFHYATYDPIEGGWRTMKWRSDNPKVQDLEIYTKDGVVVLTYKQYTPEEEIIALCLDIYNPLKNNWHMFGETTPRVLRLFTKSEVGGNLNFTIDNATVHYSVWSEGFHTSFPEKWGYDVSYDRWYAESTTTLCAHFVAQPTQWGQYNPQWIWFTDQSIGAAKWHWDFGDGKQDTNRSTWNTYPGAGQYLVEQTVEGIGTNSYRETINVGP